MSDPEPKGKGDLRGQREAPAQPHEPAKSPKIGGCMALRPGEVCPVCGKGIMNYNGLLILSCAVCGFKEPGGGFT